MLNNMLDGGKLVLGRKRNMKNNFPKGMFSSVATEVLEEELGISKDAYDEAIRIYNAINLLISEKSEYGYFFIDGIKVYGIQREGDIEVFKQSYRINYMFQFVFIDNNETYKMLNDNIQLEFTAYDQESNILYIRVPVMLPNGFNIKTDAVVMDDKTASLLFETLQHEFKHIYQKYKLSQTNEKGILMDFKKDKVYQRASQWIYKNGYDGSDVAKIFWAIYYLEPVEITANIQMVYGEIKKKAKTKNEAIDILNNSEFMGEMKVCSNLLEKLNNNSIKLSDLRRVQNFLKRNPKWLIKYIHRGLNKMKQSVRKIEKLIDKEYGA